MQTNTDWYKNALIYQIYPRSFADSNNDGIGDLVGIINKLDYLADLSIDAIWLCPIYQSPMADFGYDVSDYYSIDPSFGTLKDFDTLVKKADEKNIKIIMDLVVNHTSDQHAWFRESASSINSPKRDWYIWKDPKADGSSPNNWQSVFGGSAWTLDPTTNQYYLHTFLAQQPDLNWTNPAVRQSIQEVMRWWYKRGIYGFRVDSAQFINKDPNFSNKKFDHEGPINQMTPLPLDGFGSSFADYITTLTSVNHEFPGTFIIFESDPFQRTNPMSYLKWYQLIDTEVAAPFYYSMIDATYKFSAQTFSYYVNTLQNNLTPDNIPIYFYGSHDLTRLENRIGSSNTRLAAMALITLPGIRVIYYGDEIGMKDVTIPNQINQDKGKDSVTGNKSRDEARTPMQWSTDNNAGFSTTKPWLPIDPDYHKINVDLMLNDKNSLLGLYRHLITLNKQVPALAHGKYESVQSLHPDVFAFKRIKDKENIIILLNFSTNPVNFKTPFHHGELLTSTLTGIPAHSVDMAEIQLQPKEGWIINLVD